MDVGDEPRRRTGSGSPSGAGADHDEPVRPRRADVDEVVVGEGTGHLRPVAADGATRAVLGLAVGVVAGLLAAAGLDRARRRPWR